MAQAFGIPATPVAQPGHCAFLWWKEGQWTLSNDVSGLELSSNHDGIQWSWDKKSSFLPLMDEAQKDRESLGYSERLRWASKFVAKKTLQLLILDLACSTCPTNYLVWRDLIKIRGHFSHMWPFDYEILIRARPSGRTRSIWLRLGTGTVLRAFS